MKNLPNLKNGNFLTNSDKFSHFGHPDWNRGLVSLGTSLAELLIQVPLSEDSISNLWDLLAQRLRLQLHFLTV